MPSKTKWQSHTPEQRAMYLATQREKRAEKRRQIIAANMLRDFLSAPNAKTKRRVIESFAPHYFVFGTELNPNNPYKENEDEQMEIQH